MTSPRSKPTGRAARLRAVFGAVTVLAVIVAASSAVAERAEVLGKTKRTPKPNCPGAGCEVNGQVTGFQRTTDRERGLFKAPSNGRIVAWGVDLSRPSKKERNFFGKLAKTNAFGERPTAGISILSRVGNQRYRLLRKSPMMAMSSYYGESPIITLRDPLRIKKDQIVALTTVSWLPNFASSTEGRKVSRRNAWLGSRSHRHFPRPPGEGKRACGIPPNVPPDREAKYFFKHSSPQKKVGSERKYGCEYTGARLMYYAYFVPNRGGGN